MVHKCNESVLPRWFRIARRMVVAHKVKEVVPHRGLLPLSGLCVELDYPCLKPLKLIHGQDKPLLPPEEV